MCKYIATLQIWPTYAIHLPQVLAAVYATTFLGSAVIFTRPGSLARFKWYPHGDSDSFGLEAPFIATPELLRVPLGTAARYYFVWGVTLGIKISFGYYFLVSPLVEPVTFIAKADFSCWTWSSEMCPVVSACGSCDSPRYHPRH